MQAAIRVRTDHRIGQIDPKVYGHFIEHVGRCIYGGLWAEMLVNRKFNGPDLQEFGVVSPWQSVGRGTGVFFNHDNTTFYTGNQSQKIVVRQDDGRPHGVSQGGLALQRGQRYRLRLVVRQVGLRGPLRFALENEEGQVYTEQECTCEEGDWHAHETEMVCPASDPLGRLAITFRGTGTVWLGAASLMPAENVHGWRSDVVEAVRQLRPPILRWPGGNFVSAYHWEDGVGPRDRRPTRHDPVWAALEPNDVGTDELMMLVRELGTEPYLSVNVGSGTAEEAAAWVEYCNGPPSSTYGAKRAANGHPEPYGVRYWSIGNETYGNWQYGHVDAETYAHRFVDFSTAMHAIDPEIILVGVGAHEYEAPGWNDTVLSAVGHMMDYLSLHHYTPGEVPTDRELTHAELYPIIVAAPERVEELLYEAEETIARNGLTGNVRIAFDEWNAWVFASYECGMEEPFLLRDGLYAAGVYNVLCRHAGQVTLANLAQLVNVLGAIYTTPTGLFTTPIYLANKLYLEHSGTVSLRTEVESPAFDVQGLGFMPPRQGVHYIDAAATMDEAAERLYLSVVNRHRQEPCEVRIEVEGSTVGLEGAGHQLNGPSGLSGNSITNPDVVRIEPVEPFLAGNRFTYTFPAHSATVLELRLERRSAAAEM
jgi:alpha-N-arabinofuranosidase